MRKQDVYIIWAGLSDRPKRFSPRGKPFLFAYFVKIKMINKVVLYKFIIIFLGS